MWSQIRIAEVDETVVERAAVLAHRFGLRGDDAVQLRDGRVVQRHGCRSRHG